MNDVKRAVACSGLGALQESEKGMPKVEPSTPRVEACSSAAPGSSCPAAIASEADWVPEGISLLCLSRRGDINVLLLGDPGTAKSQVRQACTGMYRVEEKSRYLGHGADPEVR